jgi:hypothetical protein
MYNEWGGGFLIFIQNTNGCIKIRVETFRGEI